MEQSKKTSFDFYMLPLVLAVAVVPLLTMMTSYSSGIGKYTWASGGSFVDFFLGFKRGALILLGAVIIILFCAAQWMRVQAKAVWTTKNQKIVLILLAGRELLSIFNNDPQVISVGYTRMIMVFSAYTISMLYENMSGYMRGFGFSLIPAIVTTLGICGVRIFWIMAVFPSHKTFAGILTAYPVSLSVTALLIFIVLVIYHPSKRFHTNKGEM